MNTAMKPNRHVTPSNRSEKHTSLPAGTPVSGSVSPDRIRVRAFEIFQARKGRSGDSLSDWLQAERELSHDAAMEPHRLTRGEMLMHDDD